MKLADLDNFDTITIQCHDNPDPDTVGAGYALYTYFGSVGKKVRMIYSGYNQVHKANLKLMINTLNIPLEYVAPEDKEHIEGLLLTVDCQYGAGNVSCFEADEVASIDHHPLEVGGLKRYRIQPTLGSCSTLVWTMLVEKGYSVNADIAVGTALYYGLYADTNQFSELYNPLDLDMRESVNINQSLITRFRNSNLSLKELEIAGIAMLHYHYNEQYRFAVIKAQPCDPNILGLISDFLLQVDEIDICVVYNEINDGYKFSLRSCVKEANANEMAAFLTEEIGTGGGHYVKAGGFITTRLYGEKYPGLSVETYFRSRMVEYFRLYTIITADDVKPDVSTMKRYRRRKEAVCYIKGTDVAKAGSKISLRTQEGIIDREVAEDTYFSLEQNGFVCMMTEQFFFYHYTVTEGKVPENFCDAIEYIPTIRNLTDGVTYRMTDYAAVCVPSDNFQVFVRPLDKYVKVFPREDDKRYLVGMPGDYLVVRVENLQDIYIEPGSNFLSRYEEI